MAAVAAETEPAAEVVICQEKMETTTIQKNPENPLEVKYIAIETVWKKTLIVLYYDSISIFRVLKKEPE